MSYDYLHNHPEFSVLLNIIARDRKMNPVMVEKDYWIMHCLYGLQELRLKFELKGGTSLSKGYGIISRFSEDIDIRIEPPRDLGFEVKTGKNHDKSSHCNSRKMFYEWLTDFIEINGVVEVQRDETFDDLSGKFRSGGIRLTYDELEGTLKGLKKGILLEVGFDNVTPNSPITISSWAYDYANGKVDIIDNRARDVHCFLPEYTFVEKLQTISTKYRRQQESKEFSKNFMRHYYDVYSLLQNEGVRSFIGSPEYKTYKNKKFREGDNQNISENEAFMLSDIAIREEYKQKFEVTKTLYYNSPPTFDEIIEEIQLWVDKL